MLGNYVIEKEFLPFPLYSNRKKWNNLSIEVKKYYLSAGEKLLNNDWEFLSAVRYMDFAKNGNRTLYQDVYYKRRSDIFYLAMAECIEGKGRFLEDIINGVWLICEESTWVIPAHNRYIDPTKVTELCDIEEPVYIDLFSAETASTISWVYYFLGEEIEKISPIVKRRMELEIHRRIIKPYLDYSYYDWMGLAHDRPVNNWNVWINSNVLVSFLVFTKGDTKTRGVHKIIESVNRFLYFYEEDGGCDEGPSYFGVAGASFLDILEELECVTPKLKEMYNQTLVKNMASYIYRVYISNRLYVNFADAHPNLSVAASLLGRIGKKVNDENMIGFASYLMDNDFVEPKYHNLNNWNLFRHLSNLFQEKISGEFIAPKTSWFKGIQVFSSRDEKGSLDGYFVAAKGGHNEESHNHNDIGNFILYYDGKPVVIDAGVGVYSKKTFSKDRYDIWSMQSCYHNVPTINGYDQVAGRDYNASNVEFIENSNFTKLTLELKNAYPKESKVKYYVREICFNHAKNLVITDDYKLEECKQPLVINLLCHDKPELYNDCIILSKKLKLDFNAEYFDVQVETIELNDELMRSDWKKDSLYRLRLTEKSQSLGHRFSLSFEKYVE